MHRRSLLIVSASLAVSFVAALCGSAFAAPAKSVALLPAIVFSGAVGNGPAVTDALRGSLEHAGLKVKSGAAVEKAVKALKRDSKKPLTSGDLVALKKSLGVDYVVYPRVLSVGIGVNSDRASATVLVNVGGTNASGFVHTRQVGQPFGAAGIGSEAAAEAVMDRESAGKLAQELLAGFYNRLGTGK